MSNEFSFSQSETMIKSYDSSPTMPSEAPFQSHRQSQELVYNKLKISYFRRLNLITPLAKSELDEVSSQEAPSRKTSRAPTPLQKSSSRPSSRGGSRPSSLQERKRSDSDSHSPSERFVKSFLPTRDQPSAPIDIPVSASRTLKQSQDFSPKFSFSVTDESFFSLSNISPEFQSCASTREEFGVFMDDIDL